MCSSDLQRDHVTALADHDLDLTAKQADLAVASDRAAMAKVATPATVRQAVLSLMRDSLGKFPGVTPPSLNLFCGDATSDAAPVDTFARSTSGTRFGQTGLIETVAAGNVRREWDATGNLLGWLLEDSRTNVVLYCRDLTNAVWTKTNCTSALSQTGIDGAASSASLLTATAGAATCLQTITLASSTRFQTAFLKRITGSGAVSMTMDGGTTWTDITAQLSTTAWTRIAIASQTLANPSVGFKLATSGDAIAIDGVQNTAGTYQTSFILTTSSAVARASDVWTHTVASSWFKSEAGTLFIAGDTAPGLPPSGASQVLAMLDDGTSSNRIYIYRAPTGALYCAISISGTTAANITIGTIENSMPFKLALSWSSSFVHISLNGTTVIGPSIALSIILTTLRLGLSISGSALWNGHIRHLAYFPVALSDTQLQAITL